MRMTSIDVLECERGKTRPCGRSSPLDKVGAYRTCSAFLPRTFQHPVIRWTADKASSVTHRLPSVDNNGEDSSTHRFTKDEVGSSDTSVEPAPPCACSNNTSMPPDAPRFFMPQTHPNLIFCLESGRACLCFDPPFYAVRLRLDPCLKTKSL